MNLKRRSFTKTKQKLFDRSNGLCADQFESSTSPPGNPPGIWTFEDWLVQIPSPRGKKAVQMPHQLLLKYPSSKTNFVFNQTLYTLFREICRNGTFKHLLRTLLKELFTNKGEILSCKSVKSGKNRKNSRAYYVRTRDKSGSISPPFKRNVQIPPSPGTMHSQMPGGGDVEVSNWSAHYLHRVRMLTNNMNCH